MNQWIVVQGTQEVYDFATNKTTSNNKIRVAQLVAGPDGTTRPGMMVDLDVEPADAGKYPAGTKLNVSFTPVT